MYSFSIGNESFHSGFALLFGSKDLGNLTFLLEEYQEKPEAASAPRPPLPGIRWPRGTSWPPMGGSEVRGRKARISTGFHRVGLGSRIWKGLTFSWWGARHPHIWITMKEAGGCKCYPATQMLHCHCLDKCIWALMGSEDSLVSALVFSMSNLHSFAFPPPQYDLVSLFLF